MSSPLLSTFLSSLTKHPGPPSVFNNQSKGKEVRANKFHSQKTTKTPTKKAFHSSQRHKFSYGIEAEIPTFHGKNLFAQQPKVIIHPLSTEIISGFEEDPLQQLLRYEPFKAFVELVTNPHTDFFEFKKEFAGNLMQLVHKMLEFGAAPGLSGSIPSGGNNPRSKPGNNYHSIIEKEFGESVSTGGVHANVGWPKGTEVDLDKLISLLTPRRLLSSLDLAFTASSPFLRDESQFTVQGIEEKTFVHSTRYLNFPKVPEKESLFPFMNSHNEYVQWSEQRLQELKKQYPTVDESILQRFLWVSARPQGENRPYDLNRIETRTPELNTPQMMIATEAFNICLAEAMSRNIDLFRHIEEERALQSIVDNLEEAAYNGLDGKFTNPFTSLFPEDVQTQRQALKHLLNEHLLPIATLLRLRDALEPIKRVANRDTETVSEWKIKLYREGNSIGQIEQKATIRFLEDLERLLNKVSDTSCSLQGYWQSVKDTFGLTNYFFMQDPSTGLTSRMISKSNPEWSNGGPGDQMIKL